jgi:hypothetical protein
MSQKHEAEKLFELVGQDAQMWLEQAIQLKISADVILVELEKVLPLSQVLPGVRVKKLAYIHSFMLLTGLAFENLIKGILIGRDKTVVDQQKINSRLWNVRGGHGIAELAKRVASVTSDESDLLRRLEEYLFWAGRYPLPLNSDVYFKGQNHLTFKTTDIALINQLFQKFEEILKKEWEASAKTEST